MNEEKLIYELMVLLGGRVAEEIFFDNKISTGASQDLDIAKRMAEQMIINYGMGQKVIFPSNSGLLATCDTAQSAAPEEIPARIPSSVHRFPTQ